jgi:hypothetical protein
MVVSKEEDGIEDKIRDTLSIDETEQVCHPDS